MSDENLTNSQNLDGGEQVTSVLTEKPTINILLYTDDPDTTEGSESFSLGTMIAHIKAHGPTFAKLCLKLICRNSDEHTHTDNKLEAELIKDYDEIWFFGFHQSNRKKFTLGVLRGGSQSELDKSEVLALKDWMRVEKNGGGVLMTGDHSQEKPPDALPGENELCPDDSAQENFLGLGRAIGRCVPRAGRLRRWKGEPTNNPKHSFNTQVEVHNIDVDSLQLQIDAFPQRLILRHFSEKGEPAPNGPPHPLFFYKKGEWIRVFPDHAHEGAIVLPDESEFRDREMWPEANGVQSKPQPVAYGIDERYCQILPIVAVYNGDPVSVGRIVADSTWHHYLNINLTNFSSPAPERSDADQIGQYYGNLTLWLSPLNKRREMAYAMIRWVTNHRSMLEEIYNDPLTIGRTAYDILEQVTSPCEIHELLQAIVPDDYGDQYETFYFPERGFALSPLPSKELILGSIVDRYQREMIRVESSEDLNEKLEVADIVATGFERAFHEQAARLAQVAAVAQNLIGIKSS